MGARLLYFTLACVYLLTTAVSDSTNSFTTSLIRLVFSDDSLKPSIIIIIRD